MKRHTVVIDTNALISFVTDRNETQQAKIAELLNSAAKLQILVLCPQNVITEFIYVLETVYNIPKSTINKMINDFMTMPGVEIVHEVNLKILFSYWPETIPDFGDAIVATVCRASKGATVATFDRRFSKALKGIGLSVYPF